MDTRDEGLKHIFGDLDRVQSAALRVQPLDFALASGNEIDVDVFAKEVVEI
jgi:hypothetical protein